MVNDTLDSWEIQATAEEPEIYQATRLETQQDEDLACAKCVGECKIY